MDHKILKRQIATDDSLVRLTRTKCAILGEYYSRDGEALGERLEFFKKKNGIIEVKWNGHVKVESAEVEKCDLGHEHKVLHDRKWVWNYCKLDKRDVERLIEFLT